MTIATPTCERFAGGITVRSRAAKGLLLAQPNGDETIGNSDDLSPIRVSFDRDASPDSA
jgi:hypothetical protein